MSEGLSDQLFKKFSNMVYQKCGINLHEGKRELLQARLNKRLRATGLHSYREYYDYVTSDGNGSEIVHFLDCISTNLTFFFREPRHFEFLHEVLLPELISSKQVKSANRIRIWCAGCSTGEEPYSLAMCIHSHLKEPQRWDLRILATDISTKVLETAFAGRYPKEKVEKVPPDLRRAYFHKRQDSNGLPLFEIAPSIKNIVTFRRLNLKGEYPFSGPFDFIFCRNVMIYFDKPTQQILVQRMVSYLASGGYLFVGHSESLTGLDHPLTYVRPSVYRK
jgi:chemotaxis protein methyltransferase CheR